MTAPAVRRFDPARSRWTWFVLVWLLLGSLVVATVDRGGPSTDEERVRSLSQSIKCPQCVGQSVADSDASAARAIRADISRRVTAGESDAEIRAAFAATYGDDILLNPPRSGLSALVWFLPVFGFVVALAGLAAVFRRWRTEIGAVATDEDRRLVAAARGGHAPDDT